MLRQLSPLSTYIYRPCKQLYRCEAIINRKVRFIHDSFVFMYLPDWSRLPKIKFCYYSNIYAQF